MYPSERFDLETFRAAVLTVIADDPEGGDHTYVPPRGVGCIYVEGDHGSCLVGKALVDVLGVPSEAVAKFEGRGVLATPFFKFPAMTWADHLQSQQDKGVSWREAVGVADYRTEGTIPDEA